MSISVEVETDINIPKHMQKVRADPFWTFAANEWWKLMTPYVPMDSGALSQTVTIHPKVVEYTVPYAHYIYEGNFKFRKDKHPLATNRWDKAAKPTQAPKLIDAMQGYIDSGRLNLDG